VPIIETHQLTKEFRLPVKSPGFGGAVKHLFRPKHRRLVAVDHVDISIDEGESVGYVGPNGAGKSTTVKMLTGILVPTSGGVTVRRLDPHRQREANARNIGVVFGQRTQLWWDLPVQESFRLIGDIYDVPAATFQHNLEEFIELLELAPILATPARQLSLGQRMRCDLAASFLHSPGIIYLDEPTIGLDVAVKERIRRFIKRANRERGATVLLTSHDLGDIEDICERLIMIDKGRILYDGPLHEIRERFGQKRVVHFMLHEGGDGLAGRVRGLLPELEVDSVSQADPFNLSIEFSASQLSASEVIGRLLQELPVSDLRLEEPEIGTIIRALYEGRLRFEEPAA
jgi:ABC-2 type transport system ATP-binding protein